MGGLRGRFVPAPHERIAILSNGDEELGKLHVGRGLSVRVRDERSEPEGEHAEILAQEPGQPCWNPVLNTISGCATLPGASNEAA